MKILELFGWLFLIAAILLTFAYALARFKSERFNQSCIYLTSMIEKSDSTKEAYDEVIQEYDQLDAISESDVKRKKSILSSIQFKFKEVSPYRIEVNN
jgi:hypothetical protein